MPQPLRFSDKTGKESTHAHHLLPALLPEALSPPPPPSNLWATQHNGWRTQITEVGCTKDKSLQSLIKLSGLRMSDLTKVFPAEWPA